MGQPQILVWGHCTAAGRDPKLLFLATTPIALLLEGVKAAGSALLIPITVLRGSSTSSPACLRAGRWPQPTPRSQPLSGPALILAGRRKIRRLLRLEPGRWVCGQVLAEPLARGSSGHCSSARDPETPGVQLLGEGQRMGTDPSLVPARGWLLQKKIPGKLMLKALGYQNPQGTKIPRVPTTGRSQLRLLRPPPAAARPSRGILAPSFAGDPQNHSPAPSDMALGVSLPQPSSCSAPGARLRPPAQRHPLGARRRSCLLQPSCAREEVSEQPALVSPSSSSCFSFISSPSCPRGAI